MKRILIFFSKVLAPLFFKRKYLSGRHFESGGDGWLWVAKSIWKQKIIGLDFSTPWPKNPNFVLSNWRNISFHVDDLNNFQSPGCYFQNFSANITLGRGTYIAPNVGMITANHDFINLDNHIHGQDIILGNKCWVGMNSVILPGVSLGPNTIVGAGSVVTKSFKQGNVVIAGAPAKIIKSLK